MVGLAISVTDVPLQIVPSLLVVPEVSVKVIVGLGSALTVTEAGIEAEQLVLELVTETV